MPSVIASPAVWQAMLGLLASHGPMLQSLVSQGQLIGIAEGLSNKAMASRLGISARTIETHRSNIMRKLNIRTIAGLTRFAVSHGLVVVSTSLRALAGVIMHARSLADESAYRAALANGPSQVTSLLFLDFSQLLSLGEQTGLMHGPQIAALRPDLEKIRAIGLDSTSGESDTTSELFIDIP